MKYETKACIAYIVGRLITQTRSCSVFDEFRGKHFSVKGSVRRTGVNVRDFTRNCFVTGDGHKGTFTLYDQGERCHINLTIEFEEKKFSGYDYGSRSHFSGNVEEMIVRVYDLSDNRFLTFRLEK